MRLNEQNNGTVVLDGTMRKLPMLTAWANSSAVYWVIPEYPAAEMYFKVGNAGGTAWAETIKMHCHPKRGRFRAYIPGRNFEGGRYDTTYQIVTVDEEGMKHISGEGTLRVFASKIPEVEVKSVVAYAWFPDNKARLVTITEDDVGAPIFTIGDVVDAPVGRLRMIYAFNKATGFFHAVSTFFDDTGMPMLSVSDEAVEGGWDMFVIDESGFYRRIECAEDTSGSMMLQTGDKR